MSCDGALGVLMLLTLLDQGERAYRWRKLTRQWRCRDGRWRQHDSDVGTAGGNAQKRARQSRQGSGCRREGEVAIADAGGRC